MVNLAQKKEQQVEDANITRSAIVAFEIERKFLVKGDAWRGLAEPLRIRQGYVPTKDGTTVRVRIVGDKAFLTLKDHAVGLVRHEFEYPIPVEDAETIHDTILHVARLRRMVVSVSEVLTNCAFISWA